MLIQGVSSGCNLCWFSMYQIWLILWVVMLYSVICFGLGQVSMLICVVMLLQFIWCRKFGWVCFLWVYVNFSVLIRQVFVGFFMFVLVWLLLVRKNVSDLGLVILLWFQCLVLFSMCLSGSCVGVVLVLVVLCRNGSIESMKFCRLIVCSLLFSYLVGSSLVSVGLWVSLLSWVFCFISFCIVVLSSILLGIVISGRW